MSDITGFFSGRLPEQWFTEAPEITVDREEILVIGRVAAPSTGDAGSGEAAGETSQEPSGETQRAAESGRISRFREDTRRERMRIADEAQARFGRKVAWGAACGESREVFTQLAVPVMTRLRQPERRVLDTLVDAGVARSRSHALAWCVRLVDQHQGEWIDQLREALVNVEQARAAGPSA